MKEYKETTEVTEKKISLPTPRSILRSSATAKDELWQAGLCSQKKHKRQKVKIITAQRNLNKLIQGKHFRKYIP
jgi:hypothetical protein